MTYKHKKKLSAKSTFICGATAALLAQGCAQDLRELATEERTNLHETITDGQESLLPVIEEFAQIANEENVFGFDGHGGLATFSESLHKSADRLEELTRLNQIFTFINPNFVGYALFHDHDRKDDGPMSKLDYIAYNLAYIDFANPLESHDYSDGRGRAGYAISLHEASHEWTKHSDAVNNCMNNAPGNEKQLEIVLEQERDFAYLVGLIAESIENYRENRFIDNDEMKYLQWKLDDAIRIMETDQNNGDNDQISEQKESWNDFLQIIATPEGYANYVHSDIDLVLIEIYWNISDEEQIRVIAESGWYENIVEERMLDFVNEARQELGLEFQESELRDIDFENLSEWRLKIQTEKEEWRSQIQESEPKLDSNERQEMHNRINKL